VHAFEVETEQEGEKKIESEEIDEANGVSSPYETMDFFLY
jgi:hypothetical protein